MVRVRSGREGGEFGRAVGLAIGEEGFESRGDGGELEGTIVEWRKRL